MQTARFFALFAMLLCAALLFTAATARAGFFDIETKLTASDAAAADQFGVSVGISAGTAIVGAAGDDDAGSSSGSAYLFTPEPSAWVLSGLALVCIAVRREVGRAPEGRLRPIL